MRKEASVAADFHRFCAGALLRLRVPFRLGGAIVSAGLTWVPALGAAYGSGLGDEVGT